MAISKQAIYSLFIIFFLTTCRVNSASSRSCSDDCAPFIPGAVAYWPMTSETNGADLSGNENNATFVGLTYTKGPTNESNGAVHFNGNNNSYAWVNNSLSMGVGNYSGFSFSGFVKLDIEHKAASLIDWSGEGGYGMYIMVPIQQNLLIKLYPGSEGIKHSAVEFQSQTLNKGVWHFIGISYDKATGKAALFIDGKQEVETLDKNISAETDKTSKVALGKDLFMPNEFNYKGDMSCMMLFKFALTADYFKRVRSFCGTKLTQTVLPCIAVSDITGTNATAHWTKSPGIFTGYSITIERQQGELGLEIVHPTFIKSSVTFPKSVLTDLVPGGTYRVNVWHMQVDLKGRARSSEWFHTRLVPVESESISISEVTAASAEVTWKEAKGYFDGYLVDISPSTGGAKVDPRIVPRGMTSTSVKNLAKETQYIITIITMIGSRRSSPSMKSFQTLDPVKAATTDGLIAVIVVLVVIAGIISIAFIVCWKRRKGKKNYGNHGSVTDEQERLFKSYNTVLLEEARSGKIERLKRLLDDKSDINAARDENEKTPLILACQDGHVEKVRLLVNANSNPALQDKDGNTALHYAAREGNIDIMTILLEAGANPNVQNEVGKSPFFMAVERHHNRATKLLLDKRADVDTRDKNMWTPLFLAVSEGYLDGIKILLEYGADINAKRLDEVTPLHEAAWRGETDACKILVAQKGVDVNVTKQNKATPLHAAAAMNHCDVIKVLLKNGALIEAKKEDGSTPLISAAYAAHKDTGAVELLIEKGAAIHAQKDDGETALFAAIINEKFEVVEVLLKHKASTDLTYRENEDTVLHEAAERGNQQIVKCLIENGAEIRKNKENKTPADVATKPEIKEILRNYEREQEVKRPAGSLERQ